MTLKAENARLKSELKNAVLGLQREKKDAGQAKKEAEEAAQQVCCVRRVRACVRCCVVPRCCVRRLWCVRVSACLRACVPACLHRKIQV